MLERFFEALRKHPDNPHVQAAGLAALEHFADNTGNYFIKMNNNYII